MRPGTQEQRSDDKTNALEVYNFGVDASYVESMLEDFNMSSLKSSPTLKWERRETDEKKMPASEPRVRRQLVGKLLWIDRVDLRCAMGESLIKPWTCERHRHEKYQVNSAIPPWNRGIMTVRPTTLNQEAVKRAPVGSVLAYGDSDWAGDADRLSVSGVASWANLAGTRS